eukprot:gene18377-22494_t
MRELGKHLHLRETHMPTHPFPTSTPAPVAAPLDPLTQLLGGEANTSNLRVDDEDNVAVTDGYVPHLGPLECKLIGGTDGRTYLLEAFRLTPPDANFLPTSRGGTGLLSMVEENKEVGERYGKDIGVCTLRRELLQLYWNNKNKKEADAGDSATQGEGAKKAATGEAGGEDRSGQSSPAMPS